MGILETVRDKYRSLQGLMDERVRRLWAGAEARSLGRGGISLVAEATGMSRVTVTAGVRELGAGGFGIPHRPLSHPSEHRIRKPGAGRKAIVVTDERILEDLEQLVQPSTRGDPESPLRWTCKGVRRLSEELIRAGHNASATTVRQLLRRLRYSLHATRKTHEGSKHKDRDAQFEFISAQTAAFQWRHQPVISVDAKKTENVGDFKAVGREWGPEGHYEPVRVYDFVDKTLGKAIPYGVYDIGANRGWVNVGTDHNTPQFAVESIRRWWQKMGAECYPKARELLITADGGSSNGYKCKVWKVGLQALANETGLRITVCHFPPGTSKWNKIEHRMFCHITMNWRGRPLVSHEVIIQLIGSTATKTGLTIDAALDGGSYPTGVEASEDQLQDMRLRPASFHGEWNYTLLPHRKKA